MPISLKNAYGGSIPVGAMLTFPDNLPTQISLPSGTWLRSGYIEDDIANFDESYWDYTRATLWNQVYEEGRTIYGFGKNANTIVLAIGGTTTPSAGGVAVSTDGGLTFGTITVLSDYTTAEVTLAVKWVGQLSLWVAVSSLGKIHTSPNAVTWTRQTSPTTNPLAAIEFSNNILVIVGGSGTILTSTNGVTYTARTSNVGSAYLNSVAFHNGVWLAVSDDVALTASRSTDNGVTWTAVSVPNAGGSATVVHVSSSAPYGFLLCGVSRNIYTSPSGNTGSWSLKIYTDTGVGIKKASYSGEFFIFADTNSSMYKSVDLVELRPFRHGVGGNSTITFVDASDGTYFASGSSSGNGSGRLIKANVSPYAGNPSFVGTGSVNIGEIGTASWVRIR